MHEHDGSPNNSIRRSIALRAVLAIATFLSLALFTVDDAEAKKKKGQTRAIEVYLTSVRTDPDTSPQAQADRELVASFEDAQRRVKMFVGQLSQNKAQVEQTRRELNAAELAMMSATNSFDDATNAYRMNKSDSNAVALQDALRRLTAARATVNQKLDQMEQQLASALESTRGGIVSQLTRMQKIREEAGFKVTQDRIAEAVRISPTEPQPVNVLNLHQREIARIAKIQAQAQAQNQLYGPLPQDTSAYGESSLSSLP